jgi:heme exporter protein A
VKASLHVTNLTKSFDRKVIFKDISFSLETGDSLAITGKNGTGKSTLVKILSLTLSQSSGKVEMHLNGTAVSQNDFNKNIGVVSPYVNFYDEFTALETLSLCARIRGMGKETIEPTLKKVGLFERRNDEIRIFSSGMKQRLKFAFAILHEPAILFLDESTSNLDKEGIDAAERIINEYKQNGIVVVATNSQVEKGYCEKELNLDAR